MLTGFKPAFAEYYAYFCQLSAPLQRQTLLQLFHFCYVNGHFQPHAFLSWYQYAALPEQQCWLHHLAVDEQSSVFQHIGNTPKDRLFERYLQVPHQEKYAQLKVIFAFCYPQDIFNAEIFLRWQQNAHPCDKSRWFAELPVEEKLAVTALLHHTTPVDTPTTNAQTTVQGPAVNTFTSTPYTPPVLLSPKPIRPPAPDFLQRLEEQVEAFEKQRKAGVNTKNYF